MSTEVTLFGGKSQVPDYLRNDFKDEQNVVVSNRVPSISYEGKTWSVIANGEKHRLVRVNEDGDEEPVPTMRVIILGVNKNRGRAYFTGSYDPQNPGRPICWSEDGVRPDRSIEEPQCDECANCPMAQKGSVVTDSGKKVAACSQHRILVAINANKLDSPALRMKIAVTSDYDANSPEHAKKGWYALHQYREKIAEGGFNHTGQVVTKMKFDPDVPHPKILFAGDRWLEQDEWEVVRARIKSDEVQNLLHEHTPAEGPDGRDRATDKTPAPDNLERENASADAEKARAAKEAAEAEAEAKKAEAAAKRKAAAEKKKAEEAAAKEAAEAEAEESSSSDVPDELEGLLADWDA